MRNIYFKKKKKSTTESDNQRKVDTVKAIQTLYKKMVLNRFGNFLRTIIYFDNIFFCKHICSLYYKFLFWNLLNIVIKVILNVEIPHQIDPHCRKRDGHNEG